MADGIQDLLICMEMFLAAVAFYTSFPVSEFYVMDESSSYSNSVIGYMKQSPREGLVGPPAALIAGSASTGRSLQVQQSITDGSAILRRDAKQAMYLERYSEIQSHLTHIGAKSILSPFVDGSRVINKSSETGSSLVVPNSRSSTANRITIASTGDDKNSVESEDQYSDDDSLFPTVKRKLDLKMVKSGIQNSGYFSFSSAHFS